MEGGRRPFGVLVVAVLGAAACPRPGGTVRVEVAVKQRDEASWFVLGAIRAVVCPAAGPGTEAASLRGRDLWCGAPSNVILEVSIEKRQSKSKIEAMQWSLFQPDALEILLAFGSNVDDGSFKQLPCALF